MQITQTNKIENLNIKKNEFIKNAINRHGNKYDYSKVEYKNNYTKIIIICEKHGEFTQSPNNHLITNGCSTCRIEKQSIESTLTTEEFIEKAKNIHKNTYDYSKIKYVDNKTKVTIICKIHGEFTQLPFNHLKKSGCKLCARKKISEKYRSTTSEFIEKAKIIHKNKYDYSKVEYLNSRTEVIIICEKHKEFSKMPYLHVAGQGCQKCSDEINRFNSRLTTEEFIEKAKNKHGNIYDYSETNYETCRGNIAIKCKMHGEFIQNPCGHLKGNGCPKCGKSAFVDKIKLTKEEFINKANIMHNNKYDYSSVNYVNNYTKVTIICSEHEKFYQLAGGHLSGQGCKKCAVKFTTDKIKLTQDEFIERAKKLHNDKYDYSLTNYNGMYKLVIIICHKHDKFELIAGYHLNGTGCKKCILCPSCELWKTGGELCDYCKPKNISKRYQKTKEFKIVNFLREQLPDNEFIHNKSVGSECSNGHLFPDIRFDCDFYQLIIEIDEHEHRGSNYECDKKRMYDIISKVGMPCIFIRYNPDNKKSDRNFLLEIIKKYIDLNIDNIDDIFDDYGFKVEYLFYKNNNA